MRKVILSVVAAMALAACAMNDSKPRADDGAAMAAAVASAIAASVADAGRPADDVKRDVDRKPSEMLAFAGVKAGSKVVDFIPGGGYFTRLFAKVVGATGKVYAAAPPSRDGSAPAVVAIAADPGYANVTVMPLSTGGFATPEPVDIIWTAQNYHDLHLAALKVDVPATNKLLLAALKPGGVLIVVDHVAADGTGLDIPDKLHRINPDIVKQELTAAGFVFEAESTVLRNSSDDHSKGVFDPSVRGHTDQFVYKFRKPG